MKRIRKEVELAAPVADVWAVFSTSEGAKTFFGYDARIELRMGGAYEILFDADAAPGSRGSEGMRVLSFIPNEMLSFEWNAPPDFPDVRAAEKAFVVVRLDATSKGTRVRLDHLGFGEGASWDGVHTYFSRAWDLVLAWLEHRFQAGPVDWSHPPRPGHSYDAPVR